MLKDADVDSVWEGPAGISECRGEGKGKGRPRRQMKLPYSFSGIPVISEHRTLLITETLKCVSNQDLLCISFLRISPGPLQVLIQAINVILKLEHLASPLPFLPCECLSHSMNPWKASKTLELARVICVSI